MLAAFLAAGVAATWPLATYITGRLPATRDAGIYVWDLWWVAHQLIHLHNPWSTTYMAAPVGLQLAYHTLVPLLGVVMLPVTLAFGPSAAYNLLLIVLPGLSGYAMYRVARLWLPTRTGAIAAGAFFGLSGMLTYQDWYHINIAYGTAFLPVTLEAAVRLRRHPAIGQAVILGVVLAGCLLVNQESAVMALILAALVLVPWFGGSGTLEVALTRLRALVAAGAAFAVVGSPQLIAMIEQIRAGGTTSMPTWLGYTTWVANAKDLFAPSPRLADDPGLAGLGHIFYWQTYLENLNTFGVVLSVLAVLGLIVSWRRRSAWLLALLWLGGAVLALGPVLKVGRHTYVPLAQYWQGVRVSLLMPYTWFIRVPGLSIFREADRMALLGLVGAALLAGAAVDWLAQPGGPGAEGVVGPPEGGVWVPPGRRSRWWRCSGRWRRAGQEAQEGFRPCPPRWRRWTARSPPTTPTRSSSTCRSAATSSRNGARTRTPRPCSWRPRTAIPGRSVIRPGCRRRRSRRCSTIRSTGSSTRPSTATPGRQRRSRRPGRTCGHCTSAGCWCGQPNPSHALSQYLSGTGFRFAYRRRRGFGLPALRSLLARDAGQQVPVPHHHGEGADGVLPRRAAEVLPDEGARLPVQVARHAGQHDEVGLL